MSTSLHGSCACGRNRYIVNIPTNTKTTGYAQVVFNNSSYYRRLQASPLTAFLKVPLAWFQSSTIAFRPDETHQSIRRTFSAPSRDHLRHQFCGYCGTQLLQLDNSSREEDDFISLTLGSLVDEDLDRLGDLGLLDDENDEVMDTEKIKGTESSSQRMVSVVKSAGGLASRGAPWFEDLVEDSQLGRIRRQKGGHTSADGSMQVEWEVVEWSSADQQEEGILGKRKIGDIEVLPDLDMKG